MPTALSRPTLPYSKKKKVKCTLVQALGLRTGRRAHRGSRGVALLFHDQRHLKVVRGHSHSPAALYPRKRLVTHYTGGWVGPRAGLDYLTILCEKSTPPAKTICKRTHHKIPSYNLTFHILIEPESPTRPTLSVCPMTKGCYVSFRI